MKNRIALWLGSVWLGFGVHFAGAAPSVYDGFNYPNDGSPLSGQTGGYGWAGPWTETGSGAGNEFTLSQNETSLDLPNLPFEPGGDRLLAQGPGGTGNNNRVSRPLANGFSLAQDGTLYASYLMTKTGAASGSNNNQELVFLSGAAQAIRLGSTSTNLFWIGNSTTHTFDSIELSSTYFIVVKLDALAAGEDTVSMTVYDSSEMVPAADPLAYDKVFTLNSGATLDGLQFHIGNIAAGAFDELRLGSTWADVTSVNPNFILGDFDGGGITIADYHVLRNNLFTGTTYEQGDMDFSGLVDLTDFSLFRQVYLNQGFSASDLDDMTVPEPVLAGLAVVAGLMGGLVRRRRGSRVE